MKPLILPSMLAADTGHLYDEARSCEESGADVLHLDVMDGHFVPNLSFGTAFLPMFRKAVTIPIDVHLMLSRPDLYVERFAKGGADAISIHVEAECDVSATLGAIRALGKRAGIVLRPKTAAEALADLAGKFDYVLVMTVEPGYGGQAFMADMLPKIAEIKAMSDASDVPFPIMVDGGIDERTISLCAKAGASEFVAGSAVFKSTGGMAAEIKALREAALTAMPQSGKGLF